MTITMHATEFYFYLALAGVAGFVLGLLAYAENSDHFMGSGDKHEGTTDDAIPLPVDDPFTAGGSPTHSHVMQYGDDYTAASWSDESGWHVHAVSALEYGHEHAKAFSIDQVIPPLVRYCAFHEFAHPWDGISDGMICHQWTNEIRVYDVVARGEW